MSEEDVRRALRDAKGMARRLSDEEEQLAIDYLENRQLQDTIAQIRRRYNRQQSGPSGQEIFPITIPLTERYVSEAASKT